MKIKEIIKQYLINNLSRHYCTECGNTKCEHSNYVPCTIDDSRWILSNDNASIMADDIIEIVRINDSGDKD